MAEYSCRAGRKSHWGTLQSATLCADAIRRHGAIASIELSHSGQFAGTYMTDKSKKVLITGAGPGGLYASITAANRGHRVILCEKDSECGGILRGEQVLIPGTTVICALGQRSNTAAVQELMDSAPFVRVIGDASKVSTITNAVYWGHHAALDI